MTEQSTTRASPIVGYGTAVRLCIAALLVIAVWFVYQAGLRGPFLFDDFSNVTGNRLVAIDRLTIQELAGSANSGPTGTFDRPLARMTFALNYYFAGKSFYPFAFKMTNLVVHAVNVLMVFLLLQKLFIAAPGPGKRTEFATVDKRAVVIAALAAAFWGLHPVNLSSVLYVVQRMTSMSAFFVLAGMLGFIHGRTLFRASPSRGIKLMAGAIIGGVSLGFLCKENAVLLPLLAVVVELVFFSRDDLAASSKRYLSAFYGVLIGLPMIVGVVYLLINPGLILGSYASREFDVAERLLTEPRVLFFYLSLIFSPSISRLGLYHDDFHLSTGLLVPPSTLLAILAWGLVIVLTVSGLRKRAIWAFGLAWFLAGHALESTVIGLELVHEHRNYVPSIGICAVLIYYLAALFEKLRYGIGALVFSGVCLVLVFGFVTYSRAEIWGTRISLFESLVRHHPNSYRALAGLAITMVDAKRDVREVYGTYTRAARANRHAIFPLLWMDRILHGLMASNLPPAAMAKTTQESSPKKIMWDADLVLEPVYLEKLQQSVSMEIRSRLLASKVHIETIEALISTQRCVLSGRDDCVGLRDELIDWHMLALGRLPSYARERAKLELSIAKLHFSRGDFDSARSYVDRAVTTSGEAAAYRLEKALFYIRLGEVRAAEHIVDDVERGMGWTRIHADDIKYLRSEIKNSGSAAGTGEPVLN